MKNIISVSLISLFLLNGHGTSAQLPDSHLYSTLYGLSDNSIYSLYQDQFGYLWIGTGAGLDRFDGVHFKSYGMPHGMPSLLCNTMMEDHSGRLWVGTRNGIAEFRKDSFYVYPTSDGVQITYTFMMYEDRQNQLIANTLQGQYRFNGKQWEPHCIIETQNNDIITSTVLTDEGEYHNTGFELFFRNKQNKVKSLRRQPDDTPYFRGIQGFDNQVFLNADFKLYRIDSTHIEPLFPEELSDKTIYNWTKDSKHRWWFTTTEDGLVVRDEYGQYGLHLKYPGIDGFYPAIFEDQEKQFWISSPKGLIKMFPQIGSTLRIREVGENDHILNLIPYGENEMLISVNNGQLLLIRYSISETSGYQTIATYDLDWQNDFVDQYAFTIKGDLWLTTRTKQLYVYQNGKLENKTHLITEAGEQLAMDVAFDSCSGRIIVALDSLLTIGNEHRLDTLFDSQGVFITNPRQVLVIKGNQLVIKTANGDVFLYPLDDGVPHTFIKMSLGSASTRTITLDADKNLWIFNVGQNLVRYEGTLPGEMMAKDVIDGTSDNISLFFRHPIFDMDQNIWCVTPKGIQTIYRDTTQHWRSKEYVIQEISQAAYSDWFKAVASGNKIWVNLKNQLIWFDRIIPEKPQLSGTVVLEEVQLHNQTTAWEKYADTLSTYFAIPQNPQLAYNQNTLTFIYNSPTTLENTRTLFSYKLLPADTAWSKPSSNKSVSFSQLKPATYSFLVRSRRPGVDWSDPTLFSFTIHKPFWDTSWFRILFLLLVSGMIAWLFRIRLKQERTKGEMKSQMLELEMRALRTQMNPHFIYNALNSIQSLVATNQTASANKYISKFARLLRQVMENSKRSEIPLSQELETLRLYVDLEKLRLDEEVKLIELVDETLAPESVLIPPLVLQPFVENALWHGLSAKTGEKKIEIAINSASEWIDVIITDNGIGRQQAAKKNSKLTPHESTAMEVTEQRLRDFNVPLQIPPLHIEDLYDSKGTPSGTRILLKVRKKPVFKTAVQ